MFQWELFSEEEAGGQTAPQMSPAVPLGCVCAHCSPQTEFPPLILWGCFNSTKPYCFFSLWQQWDVPQLCGNIPSRLMQPANDKTSNLEFNVVKAQRTASSSPMRESQHRPANIAPAFASRMERGNVLHAFECSHRWSSTTGVVIASPKAGAATPKASWARTPRRFWPGEDWCPLEAARPQVGVGPNHVASILLTDGCFCGIVYLLVTRPIVLTVFSVWPQEGTKVMVWGWWWRYFVASWLVPSTATTFEHGK